MGKSSGEAQAGEVAPLQTGHEGEGGVVVHDPPLDVQHQDPLADRVEDLLKGDGGQVQELVTEKAPGDDQVAQRVGEWSEVGLFGAQQVE